MFALLLSGAHKVWGQRRCRCQAVIPRAVGEAPCPSSLCPAGCGRCRLVIAVCPHDPLRLSSDSFFCLTLREGLLKTKVTALMALGTDVCRMTPTRRRGELWTLQKMCRVLGGLCFVSREFPWFHGAVPVLTNVSEEFQPDPKSASLHPRALLEFLLAMLKKDFSLGCLCEPEVGGKRGG